MNILVEAAWILDSAKSCLILQFYSQKHLRMSGKCITANVNLSSNEISALTPMTYKKAGFWPGDHVSEGVGPGWWSQAGGEQIRVATKNL